MTTTLQNEQIDIRQLLDEMSKSLHDKKLAAAETEDTSANGEDGQDDLAGSQEKLVIDVNDHILKRGLKSAFRNHQEVTEREHNIFDRIKFPGIDRHMMPAFATKSANLRKKEKCEYYPFINLSLIHI